MKYCLSIFLIILTSAVIAQQTFDADLLETRNNLKYLKGEQEPFTGKATTWLAPARPQIEATYKDGLLDGLETTWDNQGHLFSEIMFIMGKFNGKVKQYYADGKPEFEKTYANDYMNGPSFHWYANGNKENEGNYVNCRETGVWTFWYENGQKQKEGQYKEGFEEGEWSYWDEEGHQLKSQMFRNGELLPEKP
jgi:antitoxin component YwqK of YwqJK toxin-antitoxin module